MAPRRYRRAGWNNDKANEASLAPLPFADITAPALIAHGTNDGVSPIAHSTNAADKISGAELVLVDEGHHALSASRNYEPVAQRQLELACRETTANP
jgi:pimeloyl-ACP methyl ester carboxylesterase